MTKVADWINIPQIEEETHAEIGSIKIYVDVELDHAGNVFYTVTEYALDNQKFHPQRYIPTAFDAWIDLLAMKYWTDERMAEIISDNDAFLDRVKETANEARDERREWIRSVL